jgi:hypothetical protein
MELIRALPFWKFLPVSNAMDAFKRLQKRDVLQILSLTLVYAHENVWLL